MVKIGMLHSIWKCETDYYSWFTCIPEDLYFSFFLEYQHTPDVKIHNPSYVVQTHFQALDWVIPKPYLLAKSFANLIL